MIDFFHSFFLFYKLRKCTASFSSNQQQQFSRYPKLSGYTFTQCVNTRKKYSFEGSRTILEYGA